MSVTLLTVETLNDQEQHLVVSACTQMGEALPEDDPEKLLRLPAQVEGDAHLQACAELVADVESRKNVLLREINQRNLGYFEQEVQKLDAWADDLKLGLEQEIKLSTARSRRCAALPPHHPHWKKSWHIRSASENWKPSAANYAGNCSLGRMTSRCSAML